MLGLVGLLEVGVGQGLVGICSSRVSGCGTGLLPLCWTVRWQLCVLKLGC